MFHLIKIIIFIVGLATLAYFVLPRFGFEVNMDYFTESKESCQEKLNACTKNLVEQGTKNVSCDFNCVDPKLIIKKK